MGAPQIFDNQTVITPHGDTALHCGLISLISAKPLKAVLITSYLPIGLFHKNNLLPCRDSDLQEQHQVLAFLLSYRTLHRTRID